MVPFLLYLIFIVDKWNINMVLTEDRDYYIEVSETTGKVYKKGDTKPFISKKTGKEMTMPDPEWIVAMLK